MLLLKKYESYSDFRHSLTINKNIYIYKVCNKNNAKMSSDFIFQIVTLFVKAFLTYFISF